MAIETFFKFFAVANEINTSEIQKTVNHSNFNNNQNINNSGNVNLTKKEEISCNILNHKQWYPVSETLIVTILFLLFSLALRWNFKRNKFLKKLFSKSSLLSRKKAGFYVCPKAF